MEMGDGKMNAAGDEANTPGDKKPGNIGQDRRSPSGGRCLTILGNRIESTDLFIGTRDIVIGHGADAYHLRLTAQNKLILTK